MSVLRVGLALTVLLLAGGLPALAQVPADPGQRAALRAEIDAGRDAAQTLYEQQMQECRSRFAVASCVESARKLRHDTLKELGRRETEIDDVEREERASERRDAIAKKQAEEAARQAEADARARAAADKRDAADMKASAPEARVRPVHKSKEPPSAEERAANEASARAAFALKQLQAEARRQEAARRNAEHAKKTNPAAPLPVPVPGEVESTSRTASQAAPASASRP